MKNNELVSIIIPVYNVEKYIERCINSLIKQTYNNIEIILVNDGSPDDSKKIIKKFVTNDKRIKLINKENGGVSSARNAGLSEATGKYVMFVDGDDYVDNNYVEYFVNLLTKTNCDMAINYNCYSIYNKNESKDEYINIVDSNNAICDIYLGTLNVAVWNKIYKRELFLKHNIIFNENIWYGEGMLLNIQMLSKLSKVAVGRSKVYYQVFNEESAMRKFNINNNFNGIESLKLQKEFLDINNKKIMTVWKYHLRNYNISILTGIIKSNTRVKYFKSYIKCLINLRLHPLISFKVKTSTKRKIYDLGFIIIPLIMSHLTNAREKIRSNISKKTIKDIYEKR